MRKEFACLFQWICLFLFSCAKPGSDGPKETTYLVTVKEHKTNLPVPRATLSIYKCGKIDEVFGCINKFVFIRYMTDSKGECVLTNRDVNIGMAGMRISRPGYWEVDGGPSENFLEPEAFVNLSIRANKSYPDTSFFELKTTSEMYNTSMQTFTAPKDSTIVFRIFGNEINNLAWTVYTKNTQCRLYCQTDTIATGTFLLNPKKFETLQASLDY